MGNQQSSPVVYDDGNSKIHQDHYNVTGELHAGEIKADVINCERIYVDKLKADRVQLCSQSRVAPPPVQAFNPDRKVKCDQLNVRGTIYAGHVHCDRLNAYDVFYTHEMKTDRTEIKDRNSVNEHLIVGGYQGAPPGNQYPMGQPAQVGMGAPAAPVGYAGGFGGPPQGPPPPLSFAPPQGPPPSYHQQPHF